MRTSPSIRAAALGLLAAVLLGALACGGGSSSNDDGEPVDLPPTMTIVAPADGSEFPVGTLIEFRGRGEDFEDGPLPVNVLTWRSSIDRELGVGEIVRRFDLHYGIHEITLRGIDSQGQEATTTITITVLPPLRAATQPGDLLVTEVMVTPAMGVADANGEWFEIHNPTDARIDLTGLVFRGPGAEAFPFNGTVELWPGEFHVFAPDRNLATNGGVEVDYAYEYGTGGTRMQLDDADELSIWNGTTQIDRVAWDGSWPHDVGKAMNLSEDAFDPVLNDSSDNWCVPVAIYGLGGQGTPGAPNTICVP